MKENFIENGAVEPLQAMKEFGLQWSNYFNYVHQLMADYEQLQQRLTELEDENKKLRENLELMDDDWVKYTTFNQAVEYIAGKESKNIRDVLTGMYEALLPAKMSSKLKRATKKRVKELNSEEAAKIQIGNVQGDFNVTKNVKQIEN